MTVEKTWYQKTPGIIALLILFFPVGLLVMWLSANWDKKIKWGVTGLFAFFIIVGATTNGNKDTNQTPTTTASAMNPTSTPVPSPKPPQTLEEKIKAQLGDGESITTESAVNLDTNQTIAGEKQIDITLNLGSDQWDLNMATERVLARTAKLSQGIFPLDNNIYAIQITANVPTTDAYGKTQRTELALITVTRETYNKIQWNNFDYHNIPTVADTYFENKSIK